MGDGSPRTVTFRVKAMLCMDPTPGVRLSPVLRACGACTRHGKPAKGANISHDGPGPPRSHLFSCTYCFDSHARCLAMSASCRWTPHPGAAGGSSFVSPRDGHGDAGDILQQGRRRTWSCSSRASSGLVTGTNLGMAGHELFPATGSPYTGTQAWARGHHPGREG